MFHYSVQMKNIKFLFLCAGLTLLLTGCSQQLFGKLSEQEANEVVSALLTEGIRASKAVGVEGAFVVNVAQGDIPRSVLLLKSLNLPRQNFDGLGQVFKKDSLVSTPTEERMRAMYAVSQELSRTLQHMNGVILARVHPVILPQEPLSNRPKVASASVFIKHRADVDMAANVNAIRALVANGVEALSVENVSVTLSAEEVRAAPAEGARNGMQLTWVYWVVTGLLALGFVVSAAMMLWGERLRLAFADLRGKRG
jgi:type III secretion protein J